MIHGILGIWNYWIVFCLMMIGLFLVIGRKNFLKKIVGLTIFQTSVFLLYITFGTTFINVSFNNSFWLIDNGNSGFVGRIIKENIYTLTPIIENQYIIYSLIFIFILFN